VEFRVPLTGDQFLKTTKYGVFASSEIIFNLLLPALSADPILNLDSLYTIGPNTTLHVPYSNTLSTFVTLQANTTYLLIAEVDAESSGLNAVPEPASWLLAIAGFTAVYTLRKR
jgi:hypothetical protein